VGYGALKIQGPRSRRSTQSANLGCIKPDSGAMNARLALLVEEQVHVHCWAISPKGPKGVDTRPVKNLRRAVLQESLKWGDCL